MVRGLRGSGEESSVGLVRGLRGSGKGSSVGVVKDLRGQVRTSEKGQYVRPEINEQRRTVS